ncbi:hypothetical protein H6P81_000215 [Aristolochia fimbriata]|uniref:Uncharacterized protein n=1 Tax=Aristolochia fimbriata TaxID=158543 RepID=A0AAV7F3M8_ARIFI|nr:hypothetical protein H6P81_000215 [Aristolochia fimbriata]
MKGNEVGEGPKLYDQKPRKGQPKPKNYTIAPTPPPTPTKMASAETPVPPPKESFARRYKFVWPVLLAVNLALGGYLFLRTRKKDEDEDISEKTIPTPAERSPPVTEEPLPTPNVSQPVKVRDPIPENEQRQLFNWILEEKRKVKPSNAEGKKRIDEEKAILKQFIRSNSIPAL